jgi:serine/threonine protein phosphatase 1
MPMRILPKGTREELLQCQTRSGEIVVFCAMSQRTIILGDLHGCFDEAIELLDRVAACASDRIVFAGDLVDRGPKPRECVELAMKHESVLGNHEAKHLEQRFRPDAKLSPDHLATRRALGPEHYEYFERLPCFIRLPEHGAAVIHAGALPDVPLENQERYHLLHAQCIRPPARKSYWPSKAPADHTFWTNHYMGPELLVFGHTVVDRPLVSEWAIGIDTGAAFGGLLSALILPEREIVSVPSRQPPRSRGPALYPIHGEVRSHS